MIKRKLTASLASLTLVAGSVLYAQSVDTDVGAAAKDPTSADTSALDPADDPEGAAAAEVEDELPAPPADADVEAETEAGVEAETRRQGDRPEADAEAGAGAEATTERGERRPRQGRERGDRDAARGEERFHLGARVNADADGRLTVENVTEGSLAAEAGLRENDVILSVDGNEFQDRRAFNAYLRDHRDQRIAVTVLRDGQEEQIWLEQRRSAQASADARPALGVSFGQSDDLRIQAVAPNSPAARLGLRPGDRIVSLNGREFDRTDAFIEAVREMPIDEELDIVYLRDGERYEETVHLAAWNSVYPESRTRTTARPDFESEQFVPTEESPRPEESSRPQSRPCD